MRATVFFKDGHTEEVTYSNYFLAFPVGIHCTDDLYFDTQSGSYKFLQNNGWEEAARFLCRRSGHRASLEKYHRQF